MMLSAKGDAEFHALMFAGDCCLLSRCHSSVWSALSTAHLTPAGIPHQVVSRTLWSSRLTSVPRQSQSSRVQRRGASPSLVSAQDGVFGTRMLLLFSVADAGRSWRLGALAV
ncbi:hypothetical protein V8C42DRAFT_333619 [Trichoderma barbatum]